MTYTTTSNVPYGPLASETMDVYLPTSATPTGAIILIHGGAWEVGGKSLFETAPGFQHNMAAAFANRGMAVFVINYTLYKPGATNWSDVYGSVETALSFIKTNEAAYNLNGVIGAIGDSAGAQLASMLGVTGQVAFVGDNSGPVNLTAAGGLQKIVDGMVGVAGLQAASPIDNIGAGTSPFFITQGLSDHTVAPSQATAFEAALTADGVSARLVTYAGGHVFQDTAFKTAMNVLDQEVAWSAAQIARLTQAVAAFAPASGISGRFEAGEAVGASGVVLVEARR